MVANTHTPAEDPTLPRLCSICHQPIHPARLEVLPDTTMCVSCARLHPPAPLDASKLDLSQASPINKNGFAPSD